jgi:hypothetical protein
VEGPADVLEVGVVQEVLVELLHPESDLLHADCTDLGQRIPKIDTVPVNSAFINFK